MKKYLIFIIIFGTACTKHVYQTTNKMYKKQVKALAKTITEYPIKDSFATAPEWAGTVNFNMRKPNYVIIHHTAQNSCDETLKTFTLTRTQVSAHYVICRNGTVHHMLNDYLRAWHGGASKWGNNTDINSSSIGIEIDNNGSEPFSNEQMNSLLNLLQNLKNNHNIPKANFIGHGDIAPGRKVDPSSYFSWKQLADKGFGVWYTDTTNLKLPVDFNAIHALRIIGYDVKDEGNAIAAFKRHFLNTPSSKTLTDSDKKILYSVMVQSL
jgi:N-acetylmuramoyl-L-alanine amidase